MKLKMPIMKLLMISRKILLTSMLILSFSCNKSDTSSKWEKAQSFYNAKNYDNAVVELNLIIESDPDSEFGYNSRYLLSEIFINEYERYDIALENLDYIIDNCQMVDLSKKSLFTKGYIYANYLDSYSDANAAYQMFLSKYPDDVLAASVQYELENMQIHLDKIDNLINDK